MGCHEYLLQNESGTEWLFIMDRAYINNESLKRIPTKNILFKKKHLLGWKFWYDYQLPSLIKKHKADLLITTGGVASSSSVAQCAWVTSVLENNQTSKGISYYNFYKKKLEKTLRRSQTIFTCSEKSKNEIIKQYSFDEKNIAIIRSAPDERYHILPWAEKENIKVKYAAGKEYFIVAVDALQQNLINVLKAFSQFKKRQQSNMQLVLAGKGLKNDLGFIEKLETFKYRSDVHVYENINENDFIKLISAAYSLIHSFMEDEIGSLILNAFKANVPVITTEEGSLGEIAADAALYANANEPGSLANQLMLLYKDEKLRLQLIEKGELQWRQFNRNEPMEQLRNAIMHAAQSNHNNSM